ncbi:MAG: hypothetical protein ABIK78_07685, partial [candidate division WOR-3 bacterium]
FSLLIEVLFLKIEGVKTEKGFERNLADRINHYGALTLNEIFSLRTENWHTRLYVARTNLRKET